MKAFVALFALAAVAAAEKQRTLVFIEADAEDSQHLFIVGGKADSSYYSQTPVGIELAGEPVCGRSDEAYSAWSEGANELRWYSFRHQGFFDGFEAAGIPARRTSDDHAAQGFSIDNKLNELGDNFWLVDMEMECDDTNDGFFLFTSYITDLNENNKVVSTESAVDQIVRPEGIDNPVHYGQCGMINIYRFNDGAYEVRDFENVAENAAWPVQRTNMKRTQVIINRETAFGENLFIQGASAHSTYGSQKSIDVVMAEQDCADAPEYAAWSVGANHLKWYDFSSQPDAVVETEDGSVFQAEAAGLPGVWTDGHNWLFDMEMDCDDTNDGWFMFTTLVTDVFQNGAVVDKETALDQAQRPEGLDNPLHYGRCGYANVYTFGEGSFETHHIEGNMYPTTIFIQKETIPGENVFIVGANPAVRDFNEIPATLNAPRADWYPEAHAWSQGVEVLSWNARANPNQGLFDDTHAFGIPAFWTTNVEGNKGFDAENSFGSHFWKVSMEMDCSAAAEYNGEGEFFAFTAYVEVAGQITDKETANVQQHPFVDFFGNPVHYARCGDINVYSFDESYYMSVNEVLASPPCPDYPECAEGN